MSNLCGMTWHNYKALYPFLKKQEYHIFVWEIHKQNIKNWFHKRVLLE